MSTLSELRKDLKNNFKIKRLWEFKERISFPLNDRNINDLLNFKINF